MPARHGLLAEWIGSGSGPFGVDLGSLKRALAERGVNGRGWRLYLDYGDDLFDALGPRWVRSGRPLSSARHATAYLRLLAACEMDVLPPRELVSSMTDWQIPGDRLDLVPSHFFRALWKACVAADYAGGGPDAAARFVLGSVVPLAAWFFSTGRHTDTVSGRRKAGWSALEEEFGAWKKAQLRRQEEERPAPPEWPVFVRLVEADGLRFVALASCAALAVEGDAMSHCIGDYGRRCSVAMLRAFSVRDRKTGQRVATLTVEEAAPGRWEIDMLKGPGNAGAGQRVMFAAASVVQSFEDAYFRHPGIRREMDRFRRGTAAAGLEILADADLDLVF